MDELQAFNQNFISSGIQRFDQQMSFIAEIDKMTHIMRQTLLVNQSRFENDAEHSWHIAVMANILSEYCEELPNVSRATKMLLLHDIVEVYAGDTYAYDDKGNESKEDRENAAADKIFGLLPDDQKKEFINLWKEFDEKLTIDSRFANCMDSLQPFFHNRLTNGKTWQLHQAKKSKVLKRMDVIRTTMPRIWPWMLANIDAAVTNGQLIDE